VSFPRYFPIDHPEALPPEAHLISSQRAREMMARDLDLNDPWKQVQFHGDAFAVLLKQPGAVGVASIPVHNGDHNTLIHVAVDRNGELLLGPDYIALENGQRCPPLCPKVA
jgi:hypothetical protein